MSHQYQQQPQGYPMAPFAGIPLARPPLMQHPSQQHQQQHMYAPSPQNNPSPMSQHTGMPGGPSPGMNMGMGMGMPMPAQVQMQQMQMQGQGQSQGGPGMHGGQQPAGMPNALQQQQQQQHLQQQQQQQKAKKQKRTHHQTPTSHPNPSQRLPLHPAAQPGPPEFTKTIEEELMVDELDKVNARDLAMHRSRSRHEYMNEVLSPVSIAQLGDPIDPYRDLDVAGLARRVEELERKNIELEKGAEAHLADVKDRFAAIGRGEFAFGS